MQSSASPGLGSSSTWKLRICPVKPFNEVPFLLSASPSTTLLSLRERIAKVLQKYTEVKEEHVLLFVSTDGVDFALLEDAPISDLMQNGEKIEVRRDEALWTRDATKEVESSNSKRMRDEQQDEEEDILMEANRIAQKIKSEIGPRSKKYDEQDWPSPLPLMASNPIASTSGLPILHSGSSFGAASAIQAFEERKRAMQLSAGKKANGSNGRRASVSSSSSSSSTPSSESSSSSESLSSSSSSSSDSSSSSSDDSSSSEESSNSSESESGSPSDSSSGSPESSNILQNGAVIQEWVPPGHGMARTQRNNRSRRQKKKAEEEERHVKLFQEAKERAEKRERGEVIDEVAAQEAWTIDTTGGKVIGHNSGTQRYKVVSRDGALVLPPGGGSLGIHNKPQKKAKIDAVVAEKSKGFLSEAEQWGRFVPAVREQQDLAVTPNDAVADSSTTFSYSRVPPPPSQRNDVVPAGVKLTSVDCDNCYNGVESVSEELDKEIEDVNEAYAAFQAKAKASLQAAKEKEEREEREQMVTQQGHEEIAERHFKKAHWLDEGQVDDADGNDSHYVDQSENIDTVEAIEDVLDMDMDMAHSFMADLPVEFGKKSDWDGNDIVVPRQQQLVQPSNGILELDYGEPEDATTSSSLHQDLKRLRQLRDQTRAAKLTAKEPNQTPLHIARMIALASRKGATTTRTNFY